MLPGIGTQLRSVELLAICQAATRLLRESRRRDSGCAVRYEATVSKVTGGQARRLGGVVKARQGGLLPMDGRPEREPFAKPRVALAALDMPELAAPRLRSLAGQRQLGNGIYVEFLPCVLAPLRRWSGWRRGWPRATSARQRRRGPTDCHRLPSRYRDGSGEVLYSATKATPRWQADVMKCCQKN
jgi:hypothetical protein